MIKNQSDNDRNLENEYIKIKLEQNTITNVLTFAANNSYGFNQALEILLKEQFNKKEKSWDYPKPHLHSEKIYRLEKTVDNMMTLLFRNSENCEKVQEQIARLEDDLCRIHQNSDSVD